MHGYSADVAPVTMSTKAVQGAKRQPLVFRKPQRITITIPQAVYEELGEISLKQGRSMSNLACFLLEEAIKKNQ